MTPNLHCITRRRLSLSSLGRLFLVAALMLSVTATAGAGTALGASGDGQESLAPNAGHLLVENVGQYAAEARFLFLQGNQRVWLTEDAVWLTVPDSAAAGSGSARQARRLRQQTERTRSGTALRFTFPGASPAALEPFGRVPTRVSYLKGNDPSRWQRDVPVWSGVRYRDLYPGVDLVLGGDAAGMVPWRFEVQPGADLRAVKVRVEGADKVSAVTDQILLEMKGRSVAVALPAWLLPDQANPVASAVVQPAGADAFTVSPDAQPQVGQTEAVVVSAAGVADAGDLVYSMYFGGSSDDSGGGIAVDYLGNAYITGSTDSVDFPATTGTYSLGTDAFVAKLNAAGTALVYATYFGGSDLDTGNGIAVDGDLAYAVGETNSADFPGTTALGANDIFALALTSDGSDVRYVTRLGGTGFDTGYGIAVADSAAYLVGNTYSTDLPGTDCTDSSTGDLVAAKLDALGAPVYTTCLGGSDYDAGYGIAVLSDEAYVTGESLSPDFPPNPPGQASSEGDIAVAVFLANGTPDPTRLKLIGGANSDQGGDIAVDGSGGIYIVGTTNSSSVDSTFDFPVTAGTPAAEGGLTEAVVLKLDAALAIDFATYLGGEEDDYGYGIAVDTVQGFYVTGTTTSLDFPVTLNAYDASLNGGTDDFVARLHLASTAANEVTYATYLGTVEEDAAYSVATDTGGHAFIAGDAFTTGGPTASLDVHGAKLLVSRPPVAPGVTIAPSGTNVSLSWLPVSLDVQGNPVSVSKYQVFRSSRPYFKPGDWSSVLPQEEPTVSPYLDGVLSQVNAYYYVVKAVSVAPEASASSDAVGKFTFQLVPGSN
jgi:hypothetical protein